MNDGYILDSSGSVGFGFFEAQATGPFTNSSINGTFAGGTWFPPVSASPNTDAAITLNNGVISRNRHRDIYRGLVRKGNSDGRPVDLPIFGSNDVVLYTVGPNNFYIMGSDAVTNDTIGFLHI
jgi:hypothetical protein